MTRLATTNSLLSAAADPVADDSAREGPTWASVRAAADRIARDRGEWAGAPIPVDHVRLVMEPRYPFPALNGAKFGDVAEPPAPAADYELVNQWYCARRNARVYVCREADGKSRAYAAPEGSGLRFTHVLNTLGVAAAEVWTVAAERRAEEKLAELVTAQALKCYVLAGMFLETSRRSGVTYLFRKLRPTVALRGGGGPEGDLRVMATLCLHSLGYYDQTFAGVMCPTDDVIAHLMMMRGDEHGLWRKANHHPQWSVSAGI